MSHTPSLKPGEAPADFTEWYQRTILEAKLADFAPVRGCMVIRPYGYAIWELIQLEMDRRIKARGVENAYFPLLIPEHFISQEKEHVEGFAPEIAWVTAGGGKELAERLAIRPTSETMIHAMQKQWIHSWRDLPMKLNQWCNVMRWEKRTRFFLRTSEFLWQEGHCAFATSEQAAADVDEALADYRSFFEDYLAIAVLNGRKTDSQKFAGALYTTTCEGLMRDGKALQMGTSHHLGQHFSKSFDITYAAADGKLDHVWQTSWGISTRLIGALIMGHGDAKGLVLPPRIAPHQIVIVPILKPGQEARVLEAAGGLVRELRDAGMRVHLDDRTQESPGFKFNEWEQRGVPLRMELGPRDIDGGTLVLARRDTGEKQTVARAAITETSVKLLEEIQQGMLARSREFLSQRTSAAASLDELKERVASTAAAGFVKIHVCSTSECEALIQQETKATPRVVAANESPAAGEICAMCGKNPVTQIVYYAKAY